MIDMHNLGCHNKPSSLGKMCRLLVDLSQGQLIDINVEHFGAETDELLEYITERCIQLRRLRSTYCYLLSGEALSRFPLLEKLHLFLTSISIESLEMVGHLCPLLKSFSLNNRASVDDYDPEEEYDEDALTIAKSMPELRHLGLIGNPFTNKGLQAILDGCPHLESLDLRQCYGLELSENLGERCSQQIKSPRLPYDSVDDCEFHDED